MVSAATMPGGGSWILASSSPLTGLDELAVDVRVDGLQLLQVDAKGVGDDVAVVACAGAQRKQLCHWCKQTAHICLACLVVPVCPGHCLLAGQCLPSMPCWPPHNASPQCHPRVHALPPHYAMPPLSALTLLHDVLDGAVGQRAGAGVQRDALLGDLQGGRAKFVYSTTKQRKELALMIWGRETTAHPSASSSIRRKELALAPLAACRGLSIPDGLRTLNRTSPKEKPKPPCQCHFYPQLASVPLAVYRNLSSEGQP